METQNILSSDPLKDSINNLKEALNDAISEIKSLRTDIGALMNWHGQIKMEAEQLKEELRQTNDLLKNETIQSEATTNAHLDALTENAELMYELKEILESVEDTMRQKLERKDKAWMKEVQMMKQQVQLCQESWLKKEEEWRMRRKSAEKLFQKTEGNSTTNDRENKCVQEERDLEEFLDERDSQLPLVDSMVSLSSPTLPLEQQGHDVEHKPEYQEINVVGEKSMLLQNEKVRKDSEKMKKQSREKKVRWAPAPTCEPNVNRTPKSTVSKSCAPAPSVSHIPALQSLNNEGENKLPDDKELKRTESPPVREDVSVGVAQLDLLGGHIVSTEKNSDADSLHVDLMVTKDASPTSKCAQPVCEAGGCGRDLSQISAKPLPQTCSSGPEEDTVPAL